MFNGAASGGWRRSGRGIIHCPPCGSAALKGYVPISLGDARKTLRGWHARENRQTPIFLGTPPRRPLAYNAVPCRFLRGPV